MGQSLSKPPLSKNQKSGWVSGPVPQDSTPLANHKRSGDEIMRLAELSTALSHNTSEPQDTEGDLRANMTPLTH
jgi:hypothetical protein